MIINTSGAPTGLIVQSGNVGIGTTSPGAKMQLDTASTTGTGRAQLGIISNGWWGAQGVGNYFGGWATDTVPLLKVESWHGSDPRDKIFQVARSGDTPYLTVQGGGNVGIGTTSPGAKLDVSVGTGQCCATQTPNISLAQASNSNGNMSWLQFHNAGESEAYIRLAGGGAGIRAGIRRLEIGDNQGVGTYLKLNNGGIIFSDGTTQTSAAAGGAVPSGAVMSFNLASCPSGWTELTSARGRYIVGLPAGGTLGGTDGTPLSNLEDRPTGRHTHRIFIGGGWGYWQNGVAWRYDSYPGATGYTNSFGGVNPVIEDAGSVPGTNAPYIQLLTCQKT